MPRNNRMDDDDYRTESEVELDSDHEDQDAEQELGQWLGQLESLKMDLEPGDTGTVRRRNKTVVTPKMAMESFRFSFLNSDEAQDVNFDAILGELCELETQLSTTQSELLRAHGGMSSGLVKDEHRDSGNDLAQAELDALASEITQTYGYRHSVPYGDHDFMHGQLMSKQHGSCSDLTGETDSAFSENASLPSSESFTSMVTVSSSAEQAGDNSSTASSTCTLTPLSIQVSEMHELLMSQLSLYEEDLEKENLPPEEQKARLKAEKIRIALEKIKEAKIRKLFVRAFAKDGSSKSILADEKMSIGQVSSLLADKNHIRLNSKLAVVEHMPELFMERILEDHDSLVENMVMWTRDTKNKILFEERQEKFDLFRRPEKYLLVSSSSEKGASLDPAKRQRLIHEFFTGGARVPEVEGVMYLKSDGKKAWKKFYFVLRASGLYYNPKGKISKSSKDLSCLVQFDFVDVYFGLGWKKKYHAPTDFCFALKHPQIQKKTSKYIRYFCTENKAALDQWVMGIRIAKFGRQLLTNYERLQREIACWDTRDLRSSMTEHEDSSTVLALNPDGNLQDSRLSMPEPGSRHSIVTVKNSTLVRHSSGSDTTIGEMTDDVIAMEVNIPHHERKSSLTGQHNFDQMGGMPKQPVKRVSFSNTHSVINADSGEEFVQMRHRDSITSASTDSSEDSNSSGENRHTVSSARSKMRAKIPVTTETTRQISEMYQMAMEGSSVSSCDSAGHERKASLTSPVQSQDKCGDKERRKSAPNLQSRHERKGSDGSTGREYKTLSQNMEQSSMPLPPSTPTSKNTSPQHLQSANKVPPSPPPLKCPTQPYPGYVSQHYGTPSSPSVIQSQAQGQPLRMKLPTSPPPQREMMTSPPPIQRETMMSPPPLREDMKSPPPYLQYNQPLPSGARGMVPHPLNPPVKNVPPPMMSPPVRHSHPSMHPHQPVPHHQGMQQHHGIPPPPSMPPYSVAGPPESAAKSPPPPMPPPGHMTKPPSPAPLQLSHSPLPQPHIAQSHISSSLPEEGRNAPQSPTLSMSSPSTPKGMVPMPPPMPLLQNQYVGGQASSIGHIRRSSKSGTETMGSSPSKVPVPVAPPTPPVMNHMVAAPMAKSSKHGQSVMSSSDPMTSSSSVGKMTMPESISSPVLPQHGYGGSGHHQPHPLVGQYDHHYHSQALQHEYPPHSGAALQDTSMYDQIRVRPGPQARSTHSCNVPPPPPPVTMVMARTQSAPGMKSQKQVKQSGGGSVCMMPPQSPGGTPLSPGGGSGDYAQQPLPFLVELSKRPHVSRGSNGKIPPATLPKPSDQSQSKHQQQSNGANIQQQSQGGTVGSHNGPVVPPRPNSVTSAKSGQAEIKKGLPPPPPKRSQKTRLSSELSTKGDNSSVPKMSDPIYETFDECEGIMDINDLPPPPPELLAGLDNSSSQVAPPKKGKPPPPPPKRNKDTQLSVQ